MRILIAYDGSEPADVAIDDLCRAGLPDEADAVIASVAEVWLPPAVEEQNNTLEVEPPMPTPKAVRQMWARGELLVQQAKELAEKASKRVRHNFPNWKVECRAVSGSPAWEILKLDEELKPELIVVGSHGHSRLGSFVLGSVSQKILTEAKCSVRIGRGTTLVGDPPQRILIGVDGSATSFAAVKQVATRQWLEGAQVRAAVIYDEIHPTLVGSVIPAVTDEVSELNESQQEWATEIARKAVAILEDANLNAEAIVEPGDPKHALVEHAETWEADCVFVGSTGITSSVERLLLGSVSAAVAARAKCSVEVVRG
jgi:nucleotide-binding universal stress UspA family protein